jgi:hypothetical protein
MMMAMLQAGGLPLLTDGIRTANIDNPNGYFEYEPVKRVGTESSWLTEARGKAVKMVYKLLYDLPRGHDYRVILMNRDLEEVVASQNAMLAHHGQATGAINERDLVHVFHKHLESLRSWLTAREEFSLLELSYNDIICDPQRAAEDISRFLGHDLNIQAMVGVLDPALYRQRRPQPLPWKRCIV